MLGNAAYFPMMTEQIIIGRPKTGGRVTLHWHKLIQNEYNQWFYTIEKHAPFYTFGEKYMGTPEIEGESLNHEALMNALQHDAKILFIYPTKIYEIAAREFSEWALKHNTGRTTFATGEKTYSVPLHIMKMHKRSMV